MPDLKITDYTVQPGMAEIISRIEKTRVSGKAISDVMDAYGQYNWLDFSMKDDKKISLFLLGATKATEFLEKFNREGYRRSG